LIVANVGDSRCILVKKSQNGGPPEAVEMSFDHKPYLDTEMRRITNAGGTVTMRRVNGDLAVSRALGDFVYKHRRDLKAEEQQVSAEPEIIARERSADDQFLVLACDVSESSS
jgi:serine/threonine protein phosphatase PrpC